MNPFWLVRMARWIRNPPSMGRVYLVIGVIVLCLALAAIDHYFGWPSWARVNSFGAGRQLRLHLH